MATHSSVLAWRIPTGQRSLVGYSPQGCKELGTAEATEHAIQHITCSEAGSLPFWRLSELSQFRSVQSLSRVRLFATP